MQAAIQGYWKLFRKYGLFTALRFMRAYYYGKAKEKKIDLTREQVIEVNGYKLSVIPNDKGISLELLKFKTHEPLTTKLILKEIKNGMFCLDLGGNIGYYALLESKKVGEKGKVIVIEPSPKNFNYLKKNLELQKTSNVEAFNFACGDFDGEINFLISKNSNTCRTIPEGEKIPPNSEVIKVPIKRLDTFIQERPLPKLDFLRTDVEGYELHAFRGAKNTIRKFKPKIQIEIHPDLLGYEKTKQFLEYLMNEDYEIKYYIQGEFDSPLIGTMKDIKNYKIKNLLQMLEENILPGNILLFLENQSRRY